MATNTPQASKEQKEEGKVRRPQAKKRDLQSKRRNLRNKSFQAKVKTAIRTFNESVEKKENEAELKKKLSVVYSVMDKGAKTRILKKNAVNRMKSKLNSRLKKTAS